MKIKPWMNIVIIKYNAGNIRSVDFALRRLGVEAIITDDLELIKAADKAIFPGVGEASGTMAYLKERGLHQLILEYKKPLLGICLGQQLMCKWSEEGDTECIGVFNETVKRFPPQDKIPHMGWNSLEQTTGDLFGPELKGKYVYFVHSYYVPVCKESAAVSR